MRNFKRPPWEHWQQLLQKDNFFAVVAKVDHQIVGGLTVYVLDQYYSEKPLAYIYDLRSWQHTNGKGLVEN